MNFMLFNPRSLNNKVNAVMGYIEDKSIDIAGICETWLADNSNATTAVIKSHGYSIFHQYRDTRKGGGTAVIFKACLKLSAIKSSHAYKSFEYTAAVHKTSITKLIFLIIYRTGPLCSLFNQELDKLLSDLSGMCDNLFLAGDLNIHFSSAVGLSRQTLDIMNSYGLNKLVDEATHDNGGALDQLFGTAGNVVDYSTSVDTLSGLGSDHHPVLCNLKLDLAFFEIYNQI